MAAVRKKDNRDGKEHDFTVKTWKEDFCFIVEGKRLYVARNILALTSSVFERMFLEDFKGEDENEKELPGKLFADVKEFLKCIYPSVLKEVTIKNAFQIIGLADEYQAAALKSKCEACFLKAINEHSSIKDIYNTLNIACLFSLRALVEKCTTLAAKKSSRELDEANEKVPIPLTATCAIQRKMIAELETKQVETDRKLDKLRHEQQTLSVLYKYYLARVSKAKRLQLNDFEDWEGKSFDKKINVSRSTFGTDIIHVCYVDICKTRLKLEFERSISSRKSTLRLIVTHSVQNSKLKLVGKVVVGNGVCGKEDICEEIQTVFSKDTNSVAVTIRPGDGENIFGSDGYVYNDELIVEVNLLACRLP